MRHTTFKKLILATGVAIFLLPGFVFALQDGLCRTPPMGWNSWNYYACSGLNEQVVLDVANAFVRKHAANWEGLQISLKDAGYVYVNLDDCYGITARTAQGRLQVNTTKFPHCTQTSMVWLADSIHRMGLKFGLYSCAGTTTCAQTQPGGYNYETQDAQSYAQWKCDYLKYDWCNVPGGNTAPNLYSKMSRAIKAATADSARKIIFSICEWGSNQPWLWADSCGHLWRTTGDINASWGSITGIVDQEINNQIYRYAKAGNWGDPDMLEVGNGTLTPAENQSHFDLWCIQASPLLMGNPVPQMTEANFTILTNREVVAVDQDSLGVTGRRARVVGNIDVWVKKMKSPDTTLNRKFAVVLFNRGTAGVNGAVRWADIGETNAKAVYTVRDLWQHRVLDSLKTDSMSVALLNHGTRHLLLTRNPPVGVRPQPYAALARQIACRKTSRGIELYVPAPNSSVQVFDAKGRAIAGFIAEKAAWYGLGAHADIQGTCMVRVKTADGAMAARMVLVK
jgi:alpha-galactosidase